MRTSHRFFFSLCVLSLSYSFANSNLEVRHVENKGLGYKHGYTTVDFFSIKEALASDVLLNARGHIFNNTHIAGNLGIGIRKPIYQSRFLGGVNLFYDFRDSDTLFAHQVGCGLELLGEKFDIRLNAYAPFGRKADFEVRQFQAWQGHSSYITQKATGSLPASNLELGIPLRGDAYIGLSPYYFFKKSVRGMPLGDKWGGKLRISKEFSKTFKIEASVSRDSIFKTIFQGSVSFVLPIKGAKKIEADPSKGRDLHTIPIYRHEIIAYEQKQRSNVQHYFYNAKKDQSTPVKFLHVKNNSDLPGDGTFEKPFTSLKEAELNATPSAVIYVQPGDGTPKNMDKGILLKEEQILASSATPLFLENLVIPPLTPNVRPTITDSKEAKNSLKKTNKVFLDAFNVIDPVDYEVGSWTNSWDLLVPESDEKLPPSIDLESQPSSPIAPASPSGDQSSEGLSPELDNIFNAAIELIDQDCGDDMVDFLQGSDSDSDSDSEDSWSDIGDSHIGDYDSDFERIDGEDN